MTGDPSPGPGEKALLALLTMGSIVVGSLPVLAGVCIAGLLPGLGGLRSGLPLIVIALLVAGAMVVMILIDGPLDRRVARITHGLPGVMTRVSQEAAGVAMLALLLSPVMSAARGAVVAALVSVVLYLAVSPFVGLWEKHSERH